MSTAAPSKPPSLPGTSCPRYVPPEEQFWRRYSPHHEFSLSSVGSFALHLLVIGVAVLLCMIPFFNRDDVPMPLDAVALGGSLGDNGGKPDGRVGNRGDGDGGENGGDEQNLRPEKKPFGEKVPEPDQPPKPVPSVPTLPSPKDVDTNRLIDQITMTAESNRRLPKTTAKDLPDGPGNDKGPGKGNGPGRPGSGKTINQPKPRELRWTIIFNTRDGKDYAQQLRFLGATLAIEVPDEPGQAMVYRDLSTPAKGKIEELKSVKQIGWYDEKAESVSGLCRALGIKPEPKRVIAFLPLELEHKLLSLELKYADGKAEEEIVETVFEVKNKGGGRYEPVVIRQR